MNHEHVVAEPLTLSVRSMGVRLGSGAHRRDVLRDVDIDVPRGTTVGLVGESGSGKSTIARAVVGQVPVSTGSIHFEGEEITDGRTRTASLNRSIQLIPQDPYSSLSPRRTIAETIADAIDPRQSQPRRHRARSAELLELVSLPASALDRYPHAFSGGQRQRIAIARALAVRPRLIIADEITSALDVSTQAEVLALLLRLRAELGLTMLFISHNLAVVRAVCDTVAVLNHGDLVESGPTERVFAQPEHPYTARLLAAVPGSPTFTLD